MNGLIEREREINRWMQLRQRAVRHLRRQREDGRRTSGADRIGSAGEWRGEERGPLASAKLFPFPIKIFLKSAMVPSGSERAH